MTWNMLTSGNRIMKKLKCYASPCDPHVESWCPERICIWYVLSDVFQPWQPTCFLKLPNKKTESVKITIQEIKAEAEGFLCLIRHHAIETYGGIFPYILILGMEVRHYAPVTSLL
jgi:hypothetical protein